jgi:hypothetical protein
MIKNFLNPKEVKKDFYTGIVTTIKPLGVKLFDADDEINVVPSGNLFGVTVGSKLTLIKIENQFYAVGIIGNPTIDCIELLKTTEQFITNTNATKIQFDSESEKSGANFSLNNYGVKIGPGIKRVKIGLQVWANCNTENAYSAIYIYINSSAISYSIFPRRDTNSAGVYLTEPWRTLNCFSFVDVTENDYIYGYLRFSASDAGNKIVNYSQTTKLIVQAIEYDL